MPLDIDTRLEKLRVRRKGLDALNEGRVTANSAQDVLRKSFDEEPWQRRATDKPYTRYTIGSMQAVDAAYTQKSIDEADRVAKQINGSLSMPVLPKLQGSVPLDVHIRGVSDVDLLIIRTDFYTYATYGARGQAGYYVNPTSQTSVGALSQLRSECEDLLKRRYWGANVDCSGAKCIALSGGSFERPVDVVPSHWNDTAAYQISLAEHDRGITILDKKKMETINNLPFLHIKRVHDRDIQYLGGLKKAIRLVKNVKNDAQHSTGAAKLPSFDIAGLMYHADITRLQAGYINELYILSEAQRFFDWCYRNKAQASELRTPDGLRSILDSEDKHDGVLTISCELDDLARQVARENGLTAHEPTWDQIHSTLGSARVAAAA